MNVQLTKPVETATKLLRDAPDLRCESMEGARSADLYPLSFSQHRLWFLSQLHPDSPLYNVPAAFHVKGNFDLAAARKALATIIRRHEVLRTVYVNDKGTPGQKIVDSFELEVPSFDLSCLPEKEKTLIHRLEEESRRPFNLEKDLMLRAAIFRMASDEHVLFLNVYHIAFDEWSLDILLKEFAALYETTNRGLAPSLPDLSIQYADFALWQREQSENESFKKQLDFWREQLSGELPLLELPTDWPRPASRTYQGARVGYELPADLTASVKALAKQEGVTLYILLLAAFQTLLHRYTQQDDIIVGTPVSGRNQIQTENLIGFFVNTLALRTRFADRLNFRQLMQQTRQTVMQAFAHQELPFEKLVEAVHVTRNSSQNPLFDVMFALQNHEEHELKFGGLTLTPIEVHTSTAKFDLTFVVQDKGNNLNLLLEFNTDIFAASTAERMLGHFETLLRGALTDPEQPIAMLPLLTSHERCQILNEWNGTSTDYPREKTVPELFFAQAERSSKSIALVYGTDEMTYRELNERSNQLANYLRREGVGPESLVGIFMERSVEMIVAWLGVLKAGGAYVPLDKEYPAERIAFMIEDTKMPVILTQKRLADRLPENSAKTVRIDSEWKKIEAENKSFPVVKINAENLAYVIYTSGSTGKPKGVAVPHRGIVRLLFNTNYISLSPSERIAQISNSSFDAATFEVWGALLHGGRLIGVPRETILSPRDLAALLRTEKVTSLFITTALFNQVAAEAPEAFVSLKTVMFGGEACDPKSVREILKRGAPDRLLHVYGPTESTTFASWFELKDVPDGATTLPIGRPISNTTFYVLDRNLQPMPVGIPGELYIGGDGLAQGYFNRTELTDSKFIRHPLSNDSRQRLYKTGDLVRYLADGNVEFLGRTDYQVKIRGFRIELEEIEATLKRHPTIRDSIVLAREDVPGDKRLVAYVLSKENSSLSPDALRAFLKDRMPDYMIPSTFVEVKAFPLTPNGKINRQALPKPDYTSVQVSAASEMPHTYLESQLHKIWQDILGHGAFGVGDNFFEIGGHSLLAVKLMVRIEQTLNKKLSVAVLFQAPTIERLVEIIRQNDPMLPGSCLVEIQPHGTKPPVFWLHTLGGGGGGGLFTYRKLATLLGDDQPSYGFVAPTEPFTTIEAMAAHYIEEMRTVQSSGPYQLGGYCFGGVVAYEMARQLEAQAQQVSLLALLDSSPPDPTGERTKPSLKLAIHFLCTLPFWLSDFLAQKPDQGWKAAREKISALRKKLPTMFTDDGTKRTNTDTRPQLEGLIDMSNYPKDYKRFAQVHWNALINYTPKPYQGCAILFKTEERHLLRLDAVSNWRSLVLGGLEVKRVTGKHEEILDDPHVQLLANQLKEFLTPSCGKDSLKRAA